MASGTIVFQARTRGADTAARKMSAAAGRMRQTVVQEMQANSEELRAPFFHHAPYDSDERDSYHLSDHIDVRVSSAGRIQAEVEVAAISPTGFDYLRVTRFGRGPIVARSGGYLRWEDAAGVHYRKSVAAYDPGSDWVADAMPEADQVAGEIADRVGRVVYTRLLS